MPDNYENETYLKLQKDLDEQLGEMADTVWAHKYFHLLFPEKIGTLHASHLQKQYLLRLGQKPISDKGRYALDGQYLHMAKQLNLPVCTLIEVLKETFDSARQYWRIGTTDASGKKSYWEEMQSGGYVCIGWDKLGDLTSLNDFSDNDAKDRISELLTKHYSYSPQHTGKSIKQLLHFVKDMKPGDIVVAAKGQSVLGIGYITGKYEFRKGLDFPHCRKVEWLNTKTVSLPNPKEGLQTTVYKLKDIDNLWFIESLLEEEVQLSRIPSKAPGLPDIIARIERILQRKKQVILYGPPGTGKTYWAEKACLELASLSRFHKPYEALDEEQRKVIQGDGQNLGLVRMCIFHPSYSYEDFIEGIKPRVDNNQTVFEIKAGIFKKLCEEAAKNPSFNYYLVIDEINRGDISRIFGELITFIETGKRGKTVILPLSGQVFSVPENVYLVGTMNTADRSIALLDVALRRRFGFMELMPEYRIFEGVSIAGIPLGLWLKELNRRIRENVGRDGRSLQIGHAYFIEDEKPVTDFERFCRIFQEDIIPLLEEYCYGDYTSVAKIIGNALVDEDTQSIRHDLFRLSRKEELLAALLEPCPDIITSASASLEDESEDDSEDSTEQETGQG